MKKIFNKYYRYILDGALVTKEEEIVFSILEDFTDRRGLKQAWNSIDEDIQKEILKTWMKIVKKALKN